MRLSHSRYIRNIGIIGGGTLAVVLAAALSATAAPVQAGTASVTIHQGQAHQVINGFGFAEAFREPVISTLPQAEIQQIGADLFSTSDGAGMSIVRFGLGGATDPGDPIQGPGDVADQVWLGKLAEQFGVHQFYAYAWSAPGVFKTNQSLDNGGYLCGVPGETCADGDFREAYADWLAAEAQGFAAQGIPLEAVDFVNEPEIGPAYASMYMTPAQAADFVPGFDGAQAYTQAVLGDPAVAKYIGPWDPAWDDGAAGDGFTWAQDIQAALTQGDVDAFFYWWGA